MNWLAALPTAQRVRGKSWRVANHMIRQSQNEFDWRLTAQEGK